MNIINKNEIEEWWWFRWLSIRTKWSSVRWRKKNANIIYINTDEYFTHFGSFDALYSVGISRLSSISTISTSPDWISAVPSHEIIIGIQSAPDVQFSGIWKVLNKEKGYTFCRYWFFVSVVYLHLFITNENNILLGSTFIEMYWVYVNVWCILLEKYFYAIHLLMLP